nr:immunoglobulin heavy chain junction region [Macaca mulatta]MOW23784.1 immunoglobulin heavy chain junction region [Macaca mulatta]MOW23986.1 immunoglobulin heavy chain junction region [Macaca mulatta]MOW24211.1 immunoglobulin heavy chain junction region [Macaca mulatta]MOW24255.1 immunoglobulin heavy chain junction region [Macaca mulatta]
CARSPGYSRGWYAEEFFEFW